MLEQDDGRPIEVRFYRRRTSPRPHPRVIVRDGIVQRENVLGGVELLKLTFEQVGRRLDPSDPTSPTR